MAEEVFVIEDELHAEYFGEFDSFAAAVKELERLSQMRWEDRPLCAPCTSWATCERDFVIVECADGREVERTSVVQVSAAGVEWRIAH